MDKRIYIIGCLLMGLAMGATLQAQVGASGTVSISESSGDNESSSSVPQAKGLDWSLSKEKLNAIQLSSSTLYSGLLTKDTPDGLEIVRVSAPGPAYEADLQVGDVISGLNGQPIKNTAELSHYLKRNKAGELTYWTIHRDGDIDVKSVRLVARDERPTPEYIFYNLSKAGLVLFQSMESKEIFIEDVRETSFAFESGLEPGDQIISLSGTTMTSVDQISTLLSRNNQSQSVVVIRDGIPLDFVLLK